MHITNTSDTILFLVILLLLVISIVMFYMLYSQNKQFERQLQRQKRIEEEVPKEIKNSENDLQEITKKLEQIPKERQIQLTPYEEEQEEKAIISYDELVGKSNHVSISYSDTVNEDDFLVRQVDLANTGKIELDPIKKELNGKVNILHYEHEEAFLEALKQLQSLLH